MNNNGNGSCIGNGSIKRSVSIVADVKVCKCSEDKTNNGKTEETASVCGGNKPVGPCGGSSNTNNSCGASERPNSVSKTPSSDENKNKEKQCVTISPCQMPLPPSAIPLLSFKEQIRVMISCLKNKMDQDKGRNTCKPAKSCGNMQGGAKATCCACCNCSEPIKYELPIPMCSIDEDVEIMPFKDTRLPQEIIQPTFNDFMGVEDIDYEPPAKEDSACCGQTQDDDDDCIDPCDPCYEMLKDIKRVCDTVPPMCDVHLEETSKCFGWFSDDDSEYTEDDFKTASEYKNGQSTTSF